MNLFFIAGGFAQTYIYNPYTTGFCQPEYKIKLRQAD